MKNSTLKVPAHLRLDSARLTRYGALGSVRFAPKKDIRRRIEHVR